MLYFPSQPEVLDAHRVHHLSKQIDATPDNDMSLCGLRDLREAAGTPATWGDASRAKNML